MAAFAAFHYVIMFWGTTDGCWTPRTESPLMSDEIIVENEIGLIEFKDKKTGEIVATQKPSAKKKAQIDSGRPIYKKKKYGLLKTENGKKVADPETFPVTGRQKRRVVYPYNIDTASAIIESVCEGLTLKDVAAMTGMPPVATIHYWSTKYPDFKRELKVARKIRGEAYADEAIDLARKTNSMTSRADKLKIDTLKWAAKVNNPEVFSDTIKHTGDAANPLQIVVDTGIRRKTDE